MEVEGYPKPKARASELALNHKGAHHTPGIDQAIGLMNAAKDTGRKVAIAHLVFHHLVRPLPYTLHPAPYTPQPTPYTLHLTPYILHPTLHSLQPTPNTLIE